MKIWVNRREMDIVIYPAVLGFFCSSNSGADFLVSTV
jgi:hypothetical protein